MSDRPRDINKKIYRISGMDCASCAISLEKRVSSLRGASEVQVNFTSAKMSLVFDGKEERLLKAVRQAGFIAEEQRSGISEEESTFWRSYPRVITTILSGLFFILAWSLSVSGVIGDMMAISLYITAIVIGGYRITIIGITGLKTGTVGMELLMTIAALGAAALGEWIEGAAIIFLFSLGETLEAYTMNQTRNSIRTLMNLAPKEARILRQDGTEEKISIEEIQIGNTLIVKPGEKIAMDGVVMSGYTSVNQASITGESLPVEKHIGDLVYAGTLNYQGAIEVRAIKNAKDNTITRIIEMVEEAQAQKAPSQKFVDVFAKYYTPAVIVVALGIATIAPIFFSQDFSTWFYRGLMMLVISCPCALILSTPVAIVSAIGSAARNGVLIKGGSYLERLGALKVIAFDKTGTITQGIPQVTHVRPFTGRSVEEMVSLAASVEVRSEHPLAQSLIRYAADQGIELKSSKDFRSFTGKGAVAEIEKKKVFVGNVKLFTGTLGVSISDQDRHFIEDIQGQGASVVLLGIEAEYPPKERVHAVTAYPAIELLGLFGVSDQIREQSKSAVRSLEEEGFEHIYVLTGDHQGTAEAICRQLGENVKYRAELMPEDKAKIIKQFIEEHGHTAMVGDGVNDAPALAVASVGIAMGTAGTDTAIETADITLMSDDLNKLSYTVRLSRQTLRIIKQNIGFSLLVKAIFLLMIIPGWVTLWMAVSADVGASILVILNGMRLLRSQSK